MRAARRSGAQRAIGIAHRGGACAQRGTNIGGAWR